MRLLLACFLILLAPAGAVILTDRNVGRLEGEFWSDASSHMARLDRVAALYPPNVRKMKSAPAIAQLKLLGDGAQVAAAACSAPDSPYQRLFERLNSRCGEWRLHRRARRSALMGAVAAVFTCALVLMARITVRRYSRLERWPGNWNLWFAMRGLPLLLLGQIAIALLAYGVLLHASTASAWKSAAILALPFLALFWLERRFVMAFVEPQALAAFRPTSVSRGRRRRSARA